MTLQFTANGSVFYLRVTLAAPCADLVSMTFFGLR
jgi:hypothetical protein